MPVFGEVSILDFFDDDLSKVNLFYKT